MNSLSTYFVVLMTVVAVFCAVMSYVAARRAYNCMVYVRENNKRSRVLRELTQLEAEMTEQADSIGQLNKTMKTLRSRVGMRELAARRKNGNSDIPDSTTDPAGWKAYMRRQLKATE